MAAAIAVVSGLIPAGVAHARSFNVPPGRLGDVAATLGAQVGVTIIVAEPDVAARRSPGVRGDLPLQAALSRALRGTGAEAIFFDQMTIRIVRHPTVAAPPPKQKPTSVEAPAASRRDADPDIIVTASKQNMLADSYPGSVKIVDFDPGWIAANGAAGMTAITRLLPSLGSTNLGPGRNKLFIRGIADSSFSGPTQATTGEYLGDVRLNYNAPDPDLNLYDMKRVEMLTGPQGTLYGAGSLGGVIRLVPNAPDTSETKATATINGAFTRHGGFSRNGAGMLNLPLASQRVAVRLVVFGGSEAGYIDSPARGARDINSTDTKDVRFSLRAENVSGWTLDFGIVYQDIADHDGQYTLRGDPQLTRDNLIAQPFHNDYRVGYITARRPVGGTELSTTTSFARHLLSTVFDATGYDGGQRPARFKEENDIFLFSHETRVSGGSIRAPWVVGVSALLNSSTLSRMLGPLDAEQRIAGVVNLQAEAALFGQVSHPITRTLTGTFGERLTFANNTGFLIDSGRDASQRSSRNATRTSGTLALDWHPGGQFSAFSHYQHGYRAGGLAVVPSGSGVTGQKFKADDLDMYEVGIRLGNETYDRLSIRAAIFFADWRHIQADLIDTSGLPYTTNIGRGRIYGLDGQLSWRPTSTLALSAAAFVNNSRLSASESAVAATGQQTLPNVARGGGRIAVVWHKNITPGITLSSTAAVRYVGKSWLGVGPYLDVPQGGYVVADVGTRLDFGRFGLSLAFENAGDARANTFAFGNPFSFSQRNQITPLRPRTARLGIDARF